MFIRHSYRIVQDKNYKSWWQSQYRPWWWPFYVRLGWTTLSKERAEQECHNHAKNRLHDYNIWKEKKNVVNLGRLP